MNEINIISSDARYVALNGMLIENGYNSRLCDVGSVKSPDILILPIKSTLCDEEFSKIFRRLKKSAIVFCGNEEQVKRHFRGRIVNYASDELFLDRNAYITAECSISIALSKLEKSLSESSCAIIGYGRIGKHLSRLLKALGARVSVFARREESRGDARQIGCEAYELQELENYTFDIIFNTVPHKIISKNVSDKISRKTLVYDLASLPGGFENERFPERALALPGKMMPISAGRAIFDFVQAYVLNERS